MRKSLVLAAGVAWGLWRALRAYSYAGKVVLITGGSRGLGLAMARELARRGARLAICARDGAELERARADLATHGSDTMAVVCDVSDAAQSQVLIDQVAHRFGGLDVLINNAGVIQVGPLESMGLAEFREAMEINYFGMLHVTLPALPWLRKRRGRIINICSIGGALPVPHLSPYTASKFAAVGLSEALHVECARRGVGVTTILPFVMRTGSFVNALFKGKRDREFAWFAIGASLPGTSVPAERAARRILTAGARGEPYVTIGVIAAAARLLHALVPGVFGRIAGVAARLLPAPGGAGRGDAAEPGWLHRGPLTRGPHMRLGDEAARRNFEVPWAKPV